MPDAARREAAATEIQAMYRGKSSRLRYFNSLWSRARNAITGTSDLLRRVRIRRMAELPLACGKESGSVAISVESEAALANLRLWEQGDAALYSRESLEARYSNRSDHAVCKQLNTWFDLAMAHAELPKSEDLTECAYVELCACQAASRLFFHASS